MTSQFDSIKRLHWRWSSPSGKTAEGYTPLHIACLNGEMQFARMLIKSGADIESTAEDGITSFQEAVSSGEKYVAKFLLDSAEGIGLSWSYDS